MSLSPSDLCEVSPIAQRSASTRLDLPQPFGPTTPVRPGSITKSVGSTNDLKPWRRRRVSFMDTMLCWQGANLPAGTIPEKAMSVCGRVAPCGAHGPDNGEAGAAGQPPRGAFPKAFAGLMGRNESHLAGAENQLLSSDLILLSNSSSAVSPTIIPPG